MIERIYFKGGPVHGQMIEVELKEGGAYPKIIEIASLPKDISFDVRKDRDAMPQSVAYQRDTYQLVEGDKKAIPYYEHI
jgi:hypothetical protein